MLMAMYIWSCQDIPTVSNTVTSLTHLSLASSLFLVLPISVGIVTSISIGSHIYIYTHMYSYVYTYLFFMIFFLLLFSSSLLSSFFFSLVVHFAKVNSHIDNKATERTEGLFASKA